MPMILSLESLQEEDGCELEASQGYTVRSHRDKERKRKGWRGKRIFNRFSETRASAKELESEHCCPLEAIL